MKSLIFIAILTLLTACTTNPTNSITQLNQTTPTVINLQTDYTTAYNNLQTYYQKCISQKGVYFPNTVYTNGVKVTVPARTPDRIVETDIDTQNQQGNIRVTIGRFAEQILQIKPTTPDTSRVSLYYHQAKLRSKEFNNKQEQAQIEIIKKAGESLITDCNK